MNTNNHHTDIFLYLTDLVVFFVTVAACSCLLVFSLSLDKTSEMIVDTIPVMAIPQPPPVLDLAKPTETLLEKNQAASVFPEVELAWALPKLEVDSLFPEPKRSWLFPEFKIASPLTERNETWLLSTAEKASTGLETVAMISSVPDGSTSDEQIPFHGIIVQVAGRYEVDPHLIRAIIFAESGFNPRAKSKKGARGLMQLMPSTAKSLGVQNIYDPEENIDGGVRYFRSLLDRFDGDVRLALAAYNAGSRHVRNYEGIPPFRATRLYIKKVLKFHKKFKAEMASRGARLA